MNPVKLTVVGCGDALGNAGRMNTCYHAQSGNVQFLIDCGATSLPAMQRQGIKPQELDAIVLSHFHGDHYGGLPFLLLHLVNYGQQKPLTVFSPPGCKQKLEQLLLLLYPGLDVFGKIDISFISYQPLRVMHGPHFSVEAFPVIHTPETLPHALRITFQNKIIAFSGDTGWTDELIAVASGADLFICECNFYQTRATGHINYLDLKQQNHRLTAKQILLTHFDREMLDRLDDVELPCAEDGKVIDV